MRKIQRNLNDWTKMRESIFFIFSTILLYFWNNGPTKRFYLPIPKIHMVDFVTQDDKVSYLNKIAKTIDYMYKNFLKNRHTSKIDTLIKRIKPILIFQKFEFAKRLYIEDLQDYITAADIEIQIRRDQIQQILKRVPPYEPFVSEKSFSPYYWVLTDSEISYFLNRTTTYYSESISLDEMRQYINQPSIQIRYNTLLKRFLETKNMKLHPSDEKVQFSEWCNSILQQRTTEAQNMIQNVRKELKTFQRDRSKFSFQLNQIQRLKLTDWPTRIDGRERNNF